MKAPQIIVIVTYMISLFMHAYLHGKPKEEKYDFFLKLFCSIIEILILVWGGFFK